MFVNLRNNSTSTPEEQKIIYSLAVEMLTDYKATVHAINDIYACLTSA